MNGRIIPLSLPKWGLIMTEGTLGAWRAEVGTRLEKGAVVADIESEKIVNELAAHEAGVLRRQLVQVGDTCAVGTLIGLMSDGEVSEADLDAYVAQGPALADQAGTFLGKSPAPEPGPAGTYSAHENSGPENPGADSAVAMQIPAALRRHGVPREVRATHHALVFADRWGVNLASVKGTGGGGQITKSDLLAAIRNAGGFIDAAAARAADLLVPAPDPECPATPVARRLAARLGVRLGSVVLRPGAHRIRKADVVAASASGAAPAGAALSAPADGSTPADFEEKTLSPARRVIAQRLTQSVQTAPQFRLVVDLRADNMLALRSQIAEKNNAKVSLNDVLIKAAAHALLTVPEVNIHVLGDRVRYFKEANISVAVTTDGGLMTPVVHGANRKGILDIAAETRTLTAQAREGRLSAEAVSGGTFTISNLGMFGIRQFDAIINPPQGAILAVGATQRCRVLLEDGTEVVATMLTVTLSCDHRAIDGALGARFLQALRGFVENPDRVPA